LSVNNFKIPRIFTSSDIFVLLYRFKGFFHCSLLNSHHL